MKTTQVGAHTQKANIMDAAPDMLEAIKYHLEGIQHFYRCINFKDSFLDAEAIEFMNDSELKFKAAINKATV